MHATPIPVSYRFEIMVIIVIIAIKTSTSTQFTKVTKSNLARPFFAQKN